METAFVGMADVARRGSADGVLGTTTVVGPREAANVLSPSKVELSKGAVFTAAPFLTVSHDGDQVLIVNGRCHVQISEGQRPEVMVIIGELWSGELARQGGSILLKSLHSVDDGDSMHAAICRAFDMIDLSAANLIKASLELLDGASDRESRGAQAVSIAKCVAENARNSVEDLRQIRYAAERHLALSIADDSYDGLSLPALIELGIACGRSRDVARRASRSGLWIYRFDDDTYHAHRRHLDPTIVARPSEVKVPAWFRTLDAGVRQCNMMAEYLSDEMEQLHRLIQATSSISAAKDVRAQEQFNFVATIGGVVVGLPALVLAVYGSRSGSSWPWAWAFPVALCGILAWVVAWKLPGDAVTRRRRKWQAAVAASAALVLVCLAAWVPRLLVIP